MQTPLQTTRNHASRPCVFRARRPAETVRRATGRRRDGISLLEVLISVGIILFGLLGVISIIPVAQLQMISALKSDRCATIGKSAMREAEIRQIAKPMDLEAIPATHNWLSYNWQPFIVGTGMPGDPYRVDARDSYAIDPLMIARNTSDPNFAMLDRFPYGPVPPTMPTMKRITLNWIAIASPPGPLQEAVFDRIFTWRDDLLFDTEGDERPAQVVDSNGLPQMDGNYTWMVTVSPEPVIPDAGGGSTPVDHLANHKRYSVSVVIFYKRDFQIPASGAAPADDPPGERAVDVTFTGGGLGGGDAILSTTGDANQLDIRENEWLLVCGRVYDTGFSPPYSQYVFRWYRVVAASGVESDPSIAPGRFFREVTIAGPDWKTAWCVRDDSTGILLDPDGIPPAQDAHAAIFSRVMGVYTKTVEIE